MQTLLPALPILIAALLYIEVGALWLRLVMVTDTTDGSRVLLRDMAGHSGGAAAASATFVVLSVIVGWPVFMAYGWIGARLSRG
jgi:hypothetical protein